MSNTKRSPMMGLLLLAVIAVLAIGAYSFLTMPDQRSTGPVVMGI